MDRTTNLNPPQEIGEIIDIPELHSWLLQRRAAVKLHTPGLVQFVNDFLPTPDTYLNNDSRDQTAGYLRSCITSRAMLPSKEK